MTVLILPAQPPYDAYLELADQRASGDQDLLLLVPFSCPQEIPHGEDQDEHKNELLAIYWFSGDTVQFGVAPDGAAALACWHTFSANMDSTAHSSTTHHSTKLEQALAYWLAEIKTPLFKRQRPLPLQPVRIPKPWGQEIWYTGVEARGIARFGTADRQTLIPHLLAIMPSLLGQATNGPLILLKILDPLPEEIFGDLYFELHNEKREVYIVTHVDRRAWPDGTGHMRLGFQPEAIRRAGSQAAFRRLFLDHVVAYRKIRFEIDRLLDARRQEYGFPANQPLPLERLKDWLRKIPPALTAREKRLRQAMEAFYGTLPLQAGDVVQVPLNVPHSLQHGIRTIEFQTPVYERRIVAFGQKVLTQASWDTEQAVEEMEVTTPNRPSLPVLSSQQGLTVQRVVDFADFQVQRITLSAPSEYPIHGNSYQLLIVVQGNLVVGDQELTKEEAILLPASAEISIRPRGDTPVTFLIAIPSAADDYPEN